MIEIINSKGLKAKYRLPKKWPLLKLVNANKEINTILIRYSSTRLDPIYYTSKLIIQNKYRNQKGCRIAPYYFWLIKLWGKRCAASKINR